MPPCYRSIPVTFVPSLMFSCGVFGFAVSVPELLQTFRIHELCGAAYDDNDLDDLVCDMDRVVSLASLDAAYAGMLQAIPALFVVGSAGAFSDRFGRRPTMALPLFGGMLYCLIVAAASALEMDRYVVYVASAVLGFTGGFPTFLSASFAMLGDLTKSVDESEAARRSRTTSTSGGGRSTNGGGAAAATAAGDGDGEALSRDRMYSINESATFLGIVIGPLFGGIVTERFGYCANGLLCALVLFVATSHVALRMREAPSMVERQRRFREASDVCCFYMPVQWFTAGR